MYVAPVQRPISQQIADKKLSCCYDSRSYFDQNSVVHEVSE